VNIKRRDFLKTGAAGIALATFGGCASIGGQARAKVVVVGG